MSNLPVTVADGVSEPCLRCDLRADPPPSSHGGGIQHCDGTSDPGRVLGPFLVLDHRFRVMALFLRSAVAVGSPCAWQRVANVSHAPGIDDCGQQMLGGPAAVENPIAICSADVSPGNVAPPEWTGDLLVVSLGGRKGLRAQPRCDAGRC